LPSIDEKLNKQEITEKEIAKEPEKETLLPEKNKEEEEEKEEAGPIKTVYATSWSVSKESYIDYLVDIIKKTEINGVVIDIKDWSGYLAYDTNIPEVEKYGAESLRIKDIESLIEKLKEEKAYLIARITVFQDPILAQARPELAVKKISEPNSLWLDNFGLAWIDPAVKESWDYNIAIAKEAYQLGFDEINFDYIRFPSDGNLLDMDFPEWDRESGKRMVIKDFFQYLRQELDGIKISADLFGLATISTDDLGIGQVIEDAFDYFDYVCPMVYPSHYAFGFQEYQNPALYPYEVVNISIEKALKRLMARENTTAKIRPWLQDFSLGANYDAEMVKAQIKATYDALEEDYAGFMLWNPSNFYTQGALLEKIDK
jgi:hypothetical protein